MTPFIDLLLDLGSVDPGMTSRWYPKHDPFLDPFYDVFCTVYLWCRLMVYYYMGAQCISMD